ncbi:MAG: 2-polyprenyl-3-methyl-6-methoxy-1,4-benzoquinone monooxygenase [Burkholderiales bacterium]|nr:2-polyprenyl-3-methyl-6-methoxy-1,4-benzoquinone monooxygenase [Burkholderiales bacterium]
MSPDSLITAFDRALRSAASVTAATPLPAAAQAPGAELTAEERHEAAALMRVNHVGEVCAQALYHGQAATARTPAVRAHMERAATEEGAHLAWTATRIAELGGRTSLLNPLWYAGAFALGAVAGRLGDPVSLGFVAETERQVEQHLEGHLGRLPHADRRSRAIVEAMQADEVRHARDAVAAGGVDLPFPARLAMKAMAKVMTTVAYRL